MHKSSNCSRKPVSCRPCEAVSYTHLIGMRSSHGHGYVGMPHCGAEDFRRTSRENIARGVDFLKVFMTKVINATPFIYHFLTLEELKVVVEEAKSVNITTCLLYTSCNLYCNPDRQNTVQIPAGNRFRPSDHTARPEIPESCPLQPLSLIHI